VHCPSVSSLELDRPLKGVALSFPVATYSSQFQHTHITRHRRQRTVYITLRPLPAARIAYTAAATASLPPTATNQSPCRPTGEAPPPS